MIDLDIDALDELEKRLIPLLKRRGIKVESMQPIGLLGRGGSGSVFSLLINHEYYVIKLYYERASYQREARNRRRLVWPPEVLLTSRSTENSLGYDLVITKVPEGESFNSHYLLDWVQEKFGRHLVELHRLRRKRRVSIASLRQALRDVEYGAMAAAKTYGGEGPDVAWQTMHEMRVFLDDNAGMMRVQPSLLHNDLWWDNIIVSRDDVYLIDFEWIRVGDYLEDLANARTMLVFTPVYDKKRSFWRDEPDEAAADRFFAGIVAMHRQELDDKTANERLRFYLALQSLRRLSDYNSGLYHDQPKLLAYWIEQLPKFWHYGLEPAVRQ